MIAAAANTIRRTPAQRSVLGRSLCLTLTLLSVSGGFIPLAAQERWVDVFRAGKFSDALAISDQQLKLHPRNATLWTERALTLEALQRYKESIISFQRALSYEPAFLPALEGAAQLTYRLRDPSAQTFLSELLRFDRQNPTANAMAGVLSFERHDCPGAVTHFENAGAGLVENEQAYSLYGACLLELRDAHKAASVFDRLTQQFPASVNVRYNLGYAQFLAGTATDAITTLRPLTQGEHPDAGALNLIASAEASQGQIAAALADLKTAAHINPLAEENYLDFASLCLENNSPDLAEDTVTIGLRNVPNSARLYSILGIIYAEQNKSDESAEQFERANRLSPDKSYGSVGLSMLYAESKHPEDAERLLRAKLKDAPNDADLNYLLADILINRSDSASANSLPEGRIALLKSIASRPSFSNAHALLGKLYRHSGEEAKAIQEFKQALAGDPDNRVALNQIVSLLRASGHENEASVYSIRLRKLIQQELKDSAGESRIRIVRTQ